MASPTGLRVPHIVTQALFTQRLRIISAAEVHNLSAFVCSHRTKQLQHKAAPMCQFIQQNGLQIQKRCDSTHHDVDASFFFNIFPVYLNMYLLTVYNQIDANQPCILESDKVMVFTLIIAINTQNQNSFISHANMCITTDCYISQL